MRVTLILHMITIRLATLFLLFRTSSSTSSDAGTSAFSKPYESIEENGSSIAIPKIATVAFAADGYGRYLSKLLAVVEQLRSAPNGQSYRLIAYNLGGVPNATAQALRCAAPRLLDELRDFNFSAFPAHVKVVPKWKSRKASVKSLNVQFSSSSNLLHSIYHFSTYISPPYSFSQFKFIPPPPLVLSVLNSSLFSSRAGPALLRLEALASLSTEARVPSPRLSLARQRSRTRRRAWWLS